MSANLAERNWCMAQDVFAHTLLLGSRVCASRSAKLRRAICRFICGRSADTLVSDLPVMLRAIRRQKVRRSE
jgi:hypothetical protein